MPRTTYSCASCGEIGRVAKWLSVNDTDGYEISKDAVLISRNRGQYKGDFYPVCQNCYQYPEYECASCGEVRKTEKWLKMDDTDGYILRNEAQTIQVKTNKHKGDFFPICKNCYRQPSYVCASCGDKKRVLKWLKIDNTFGYEIRSDAIKISREVCKCKGDFYPICKNCYKRTTTYVCASCGTKKIIEKWIETDNASEYEIRSDATKISRGVGKRKGYFYPICKNCYQQPLYVCGSCGELKKVDKWLETNNTSGYEIGIDAKKILRGVGKGGVGKCKGQFYPICQYCYQHPTYNCASCGDDVEVAKWLETNNTSGYNIRTNTKKISRGVSKRKGEFYPICKSCYKQPLYVCTSCGNKRKVWKWLRIDEVSDYKIMNDIKPTLRGTGKRMGDFYPVCQNCYQQPMYDCASCGERRKSEKWLDINDISGYEIRNEAVSILRRNGKHKGQFYPICPSCRQKPTYICASCGNKKMACSFLEVNKTFHYQIRDDAIKILRGVGKFRGEFYPLCERCYYVCVGCGEYKSTFDDEHSNKKRLCSDCAHKRGCHKQPYPCKANEPPYSFSCPQRKNKYYDGFCGRCYCRLFPNTPKALNYKKKSKEWAVVTHVSNHHEGFYHEKAFYYGCCGSKNNRRIDLYKQIGNTILCIEVDEHEHTRYSLGDERNRYDNIFESCGQKMVFIRYNPDKYKGKDSRIRNPRTPTRLKALSKRIEELEEKITNEENEGLCEIYFLFYDETDKSMAPQLILTRE